MKVDKDIEASRASWSFSGKVPEAFVEHVRQSVPYYDAGHQLVCDLSDYFCHADSTCYEIGVSTGQLIRRLAEHHPNKPGIDWVGIDPVDEMIVKAKQHCAGIPNITLEDGRRADVRLRKGGPLRVVLLRPVHRTPQPAGPDQPHLRALNWGGAFLMFEKVRAPDARFQDIMVSLYNDFKARNGFSAEEILNKTASLKGVLEPFSTEGNLGLLRRAGFVTSRACSSICASRDFSRSSDASDRMSA
jgi:tRNA (cmo5U34)-methyltransferase